MLGTLMTVLFLVARMVGKFGTEMFREEPVRYRVYQPLPWYVQSVRHNRNRRSSQLEEKDAGSRRRSVNSFKNSTVKGIPHPSSEGRSNFLESNCERAAVTIQSQYRRYQRRKKCGRDL
ncbi:uncharacterized protein [Chiloscyllium punctatum]|uniref:Chloride channel CLIC-like protein 1 n=1 Tax=Chiloscyllium punctatum TaxID=137246 RepID=A0A401RYD0_CHIPU|nr:hypothetical protein [Chiloscyllium punctatum]